MALFELTVKGQYVAAFRAEMLGQLLDEGDRAMGPARTADRNGDVAAILPLEAGKPLFEPASHVVIVLAYQRVRVEELPDRLVLARKGTQARIPVRVGQAAGVEDEIGVRGQAPAVGKRLEQKGGAVRSRRVAGGEQAPQLVDVEVAGVD